MATGYRTFRIYIRNALNSVQRRSRPQMEKAVAYCTASQGLSTLSRTERNAIADAQSARAYHIQTLSDELKAANWSPKQSTIGDAPMFVVPRTRKVVAQFTLEDILHDLHSTMHSVTENSERSIDELVAEHILQKYTEHVPCGARLTRKVSDDERAIAQPLTNTAALEKVVELDERLRALRQPFKDQRKPHQKTKRLLETEVMQNIGENEQTVNTGDGSFVLKCRTQRRPGKFSAREITRAVKEATSEFVEGHSLDDNASHATVAAMSCDEFVTLLASHLTQTASDAMEEETKVKLQCVRQ